MTKAQTANLIRGLVRAIPGLRLTAEEVDEAVATYHTLIEPYPWEMVQAAGARVMATHKIHTLPTPGEILSAIVDLAVADIPPALEAWHRVRQTLVQTRGGRGTREALVDTNPIAARVLELMGAERVWWEACSTVGEHPDAMRREFERHYREQVQLARDRALTPKALSGMCWGVLANSPAVAIPSVAGLERADCDSEKETE